MLPLAFSALAGFALLADHRDDPRASGADRAGTGATAGDAPLASSPFPAPLDLGAPEAHAFGFELLSMGLWDQAETILLDACETGDLTACQVLADEYAKLGRDGDADERYLAACDGGQFQGCRALLDRPRAAEAKRSAAASRLERDCLDDENGSACQLLSGSLWAKANPRLERRYRGLACSRGIESSCRPSSVAANASESHFNQ